jgi:glycosyltransferase involved in cell wall biosynthesis
VEAFSRTPERKLVVVGDGPDLAKVKAKAGMNVEILGFQPHSVLCDLMQRARAFVFAAEEDFGITPVEAQAAGAPVIAFGKGGALETVRGLNDHSPTGVFFEEQEVESVLAAVAKFERNVDRFSPAVCRENALRFSVERFQREFSAYVARRWDEFQSAKAPRKLAQRTPQSGVHAL